MLSYAWKGKQRRVPCKVVWVQQSQRFYIGTKIPPIVPSPSKKKL